MRFKYCFVFIAFFLSCVDLIAQSEMDQELLALATKAGIEPLSKLPAKNDSLFNAGRILFESEVLSGNRNISCLTCHDPAKNTGDGLALSVGQGREDSYQADGVVLRRHSPPLFNTGHPDVRHMFWDRRVRKHYDEERFITPEPRLNRVIKKNDPLLSVFKRTADIQALFPLTSRDEMRGWGNENEFASAATNMELWERVLVRIKAELPDVIDLLVKGFELNSSDALNIAHIGTAIGEFISYEFRADNTPMDRFLRGEWQALTDQQKLGFNLFLNKARCAFCHNGPTLSNGISLNIGIPPIKTKDLKVDMGEFDETDSIWDFNAFKVPPLRNVKVTAPYMHNGIFNNLEDVITHYENVFDTLYKQDIDPSHLSFYTVKIKRVNDKKILDKIADRVSPLVERPQRLKDHEKRALLDFIENGLYEPN